MDKWRKPNADPWVMLDKKKQRKYDITTCLPIPNAGWVRVLDRNLESNQHNTLISKGPALPPSSHLSASCPAPRQPCSASVFSKEDLSLFNRFCVEGQVLCHITISHNQHALLESQGAYGDLKGWLLVRPMAWNSGTGDAERPLDASVTEPTPPARRFQLSPFSVLMYLLQSTN